jgi:hypothetical protein
LGFDHIHFPHHKTFELFSSMFFMGCS